MRRALSVSDILRQRKNVLDFTGDWFAAFDKPEACGVWFVWGNSANGKTSFVLLLMKYLTRFGRVCYNALEEGEGLTTQRSFERLNMQDVGRKLTVVMDNIEELDKRMSRRKSPRIWIIDSFQYTGLNYRSYLKFKERHKDKLIIFISHAAGKQPLGGSAVSCMYDADLKIWVEGFRAFSKGRFIGTAPHFTIWDEGAMRYWGEW